MCCWRFEIDDLTVALPLIDDPFRVVLMMGANLCDEMDERQYKQYKQYVIKAHSALIAPHSMLNPSGRV